MGDMMQRLRKAVHDAAGSVQDSEGDEFSFTGWSDEIIKAILTELLEPSPAMSEKIFMRYVYGQQERTEFYQNLIRDILEGRA